MSVKLYRLYCEICNWKLVTDGSDEQAKKLVEVIAAPIPTGSPWLDEETKNIVVPPPRKQLKRFRCPQCGRLVRPTKIDDSQSKLEDQKDIKKRVEQRHEEDWSIGRKESAERWKIQGFTPPGISSEISEGDGEISL